MPHPVEIDALPHQSLGFHTYPVILSGVHDSLSYMLSAAQKHPQVFWHFKEGHVPVLVSPLRDDLDGFVKQAIPIEGRDILRVMTEYNAAKINYGSAAMASLLHGKPIELEGGELERQRQDNMRHERFVELRQTQNHVVSRAEMIDALQKYGRFHFYNDDPSSSKSFKVTVENWDAVQPLTVMDIKIEPFSDWAVSHTKSALDKLRSFRF